MLRNHDVTEIPIFGIDSSVLHNVLGIDSSVMRNVFGIAGSVLRNVFDRGVVSVLLIGVSHSGCTACLFAGNGVSPTMEKRRFCGHDLFQTMVGVS